MQISSTYTDWLIFFVFQLAQTVTKKIHEEINFDGKIGRSKIYSLRGQCNRCQLNSGSELFDLCIFLSFALPLPYAKSKGRNGHQLKIKQSWNVITGFDYRQPALTKSDHPNGVMCSKSYFSKKAIFDFRLIGMLANISGLLLNRRAGARIVCANLTALLKDLSMILVCLFTLNWLSLSTRLCSQSACQNNA